MDSYTAQADAIRSAITSASTCTPAISASLKELLQGRQEKDDKTSKPSRSTTQKPTRVTSRTKPPATKPVRRGTRNAPAPAQATDLSNGTSVWGIKEKASLATKVVNATLKALGEAAKTTPGPNPAPPSTTNDTTNPTARTGLQRSTSAPMTPLKPRALNRVSSTPVVTKTSSLPTTASTDCLSLVECARTAFATLRSLLDSGAIKLPELQLETGMSALISKLIVLKLHDHAVKESRILKRRLEGMVMGDGSKSKTTTASSTNAPPETLSDLLDYPPGNYPEPLVSFVINTQLQTLRMFHELKKTTTLEAILPFLRPQNPASPLSLLLARSQTENKERLKTTKQLENLSQTLLHLTPSLATKEDKAAQEPRLNPSPEVALEVQTLGLVARLESWRISGQVGDINKDILFPLSRCLVAFWRRVSPDKGPKLIAAFGQVWEKINEFGFQITPSCKESLSPIYQLAVMAAQESGNIGEAKRWGSKLNGLMSEEEDSVAKCCAATAQLLALSLRDTTKMETGLVQQLMTQVLKGMQGTLSGSIAELDDLLVNLCLLRKAVCNITNKAPAALDEASKEGELLEEFIFQLPRFAVRWLGKPPSSDSPTKDVLRFEQRRQLLSKYQRPILDSALMFQKALMDKGRTAWEAMDSLLQDCLLLLEYMDGFGQPSFESNPAASYHVKISHLYFQYHSAYRNRPSEETEASSLRSLKRSIDSLKERSEVEQARGLLLKKWEMFVEVCKASNRKSDAINALRSIRDHLVRCDTVSAITASLASESLAKSWCLNPEAELLSRTVCNLAKLERKARDWTWLLTGEDKATALEHDLHFALPETSTSDPIVINLLQSYSVEQYPIRRLRSLLTLLIANIDCIAQVETLRADVRQVLGKLDGGDLGKDARLARYGPYLRHLAECLCAMACGNFESEEIQRAVTGWKGIVSNCQTATELADRVDNPQQLLGTLQSLVDLARMKGFQTLSTDIMELSTKVSQLTIDDNIELHILHSSSLFLQYVTLGQSAKAEKLLQSTMDSVSLSGVSSEVASSFHLAASEYYLAIGCFDKAEKHLSKARDVVLALADQSQKRWRQVNRKIAIAYASFLTSNLCLERGENHRALKLAKNAVKILFSDWSQLEQLRKSVSDVSVDSSVSQTDSAGEDSSFNSSRMSDIDITRANTGPEFWALVHPLYRFTQQLSSTYAHLGMYQETAYYAEQAQKIAESMGSSYYLAQATTWMASVSLMAGESKKSVGLLEDIRPLLLASEPSSETVTALCQAASVYREAEEEDFGATLLKSAESMLQDLESKSTEGEAVAKDGSETIPAKPTKPALKEVTLPLRPATRTTRATKPTAKSGSTVAKASTRKTAVKEVKTPVKPAEVAREEDARLKSLQASILHSRSLALIKDRDWPAAITALRSAAQLSKLPSDLLRQHFVLGMSLVGQSLQQMGTDSVFSFIQDSTLSFPSVTLAARDNSSHTQALVKSHNKHSFVQNLHEAEEHLLEAHSLAMRNGNGGLVHNIAVVLQKVAILLSNTGSLASGISHPAHATCSIELARNLTWRRERKANRPEAAKDTKATWPIVIDSENPRRSSLGFSIDMGRFQREYVDIIPKNWDVVSVSLSEDKHDLCITKLQAGLSPFALRLPLERANSRDADTDIFDFQQGRSELLDIIQAANRTCHDARDRRQPEEKAAWWAEREELDRRLKELLGTIEELWLGGFKGIFSQHHQRPDLLARFQKTFHLMLDKYLPSRRQVRGRKVKAVPAKVHLDPRILELFVGLGDATARGCDFDDVLTDLLYFVVDVLQFHGETNAYDEIDFDSMVVETYTALRAYHSLAKEDGEKQEETHTILILDKSLHVFPWESLPCLERLAISRVPSLDCLRRSIIESRVAAAAAAPSAAAAAGHESDEDSDSDISTSSCPSRRTGHHVSINSGTYILNPSTDLTTTQETFGRALSTLPASWQAIESRAPTEAEFEASLTSHDTLLYFGHGSGAQYIRGRTVRQLDKCRAVALLMGCSSASLVHAGDFEPYGPVWNYMLAGSPAVVGTLWDVTDRDIDRFAAAAFEEWGLFPRGTFEHVRYVAKGKSKTSSSKGGSTAAASSSSVAEVGMDVCRSNFLRTAPAGNSKGKGVEKGGAEKEKDIGMLLARASLVEAVAKARMDACRFRYLTAAAVCVYGIPVYVDRGRSS